MMAELTVIGYSGYSGYGSSGSGSDGSWDPWGSDDGDGSRPWDDDGGDDDDKEGGGDSVLFWQWGKEKPFISKTSKCHHLYIIEK